MSNLKGLYELLFNRLKELETSNNRQGRIIRFPLVFLKLCRNFSMTKAQAWEIIFELRDLGIIEIVPFQGIKLKKRNQT